MTSCAPRLSFDWVEHRGRLRIGIAGFAVGPESGRLGFTRDPAERLVTHFGRSPIRYRTTQRVFKNYVPERLTAIDTRNTIWRLQNRTGRDGWRCLCCCLGIAVQVHSTKASIVYITGPLIKIRYPAPEHTDHQVSETRDYFAICAGIFCLLLNQFTQRQRCGQIHQPYRQH
jgi:hypothetical protein